MDNDSGMIVILTVLIVSAFLPIIYKLAEFFTEFNRDTQYILLEMNRAVVLTYTVIGAESCDAIIFAWFISWSSAMSCGCITDSITA